MINGLRSKVTIAVLLMGAWAVTVEAAPIQGGLSITGNFVPVIGSTGAASTLSLATGLDFINLFGSTPTPGTDGTLLVNSATKDLATLAGSGGTIRDFTFAGPGSLSFPNTPLLGFQHIGGLTFDLSSVSVVTQTADFLILSGSGLFHLAGYNDTAGTFRFSANGADNSFSFSASQAATATVPEPASLLFLGTGLMIGGYQLRRRTRPE